MQIAGDIDIVDGDQAGLAYGEFAANDLADFPFQEFTNALKSKRRHTKGGSFRFQGQPPEMLRGGSRS
jgi:hypothetical protein